MTDEYSPESPAPESPFPVRAPYCLHCVHFSVSWDPVFPRSCDYFGFKSKNLPSHEVFKSTGRHCPRFRERERRD
ncbi:MAG: hypothetical protein LBG10_03980 [Treponema sp.]|nr:hypothetical protein [Treponema sp.]